MKLYQRFADKGYHTSVITTFGIDFDAYENIVLPRLRGSGCRNNLVLADRRMVTLALDGHSPLPSHAGSRYTISGVESAGGVFHPKVFLQVGRHGARLMIGSANLTAPGLAGNLELVATFHCGEDDSDERRLIAQAWRFLAGLLDSEQAAQSEWMLTRATWLRIASPAVAPTRIGDGTEVSLLFSGAEQGIGHRFASLVDAPVTRLVAISPYWDASLEALVDLQSRLRPERIGVLIDPATRAFPKEAAARRIRELGVYDRRGFHGDRFMHAKAILAISDDADHLLIGSANCTSAALGGASGPGRNVEVCVYRRLPPGTAIENLGLSAALSEDRRVDASDLPPSCISNDIPLGELAKRSPGAFRSQADSLLWRPAPRLDDPQSRTVVLVDRFGSDLSSNPEYLRSSSDGLHYRMPAGERPAAFARVAASGSGESALAVVTQLDTLKEEVREVGSPRTEAIRKRLALGGDVEATLELLGIIDELEASASDRPSLGLAVSIPRSEVSDGLDCEPAPGFRRLSYEAFMAHRRPHDTRTRPPASLAGTDLSLVRTVLNRIGGDETAGLELPDEAEDAVTVSALDLSDETAAQDAQDAGTGHESVALPRTRTSKSTPRSTKAATAAQIIKANSRFMQAARGKRERGELSPTDLLRLRALLLVACYAALPPLGHSDCGEPRSDLQVLVAEGPKAAWWREIGRLLNAFFRPGDPAISLSLTDEHEQIPVDVVECWATCFWCLQVCLTVPVGQTAKQLIQRWFPPLADRVYRLTLLTREELVAGRVKEVMDGMSEKLAARLGVDSQAIAAGHHRMTFRGAMSLERRQEAPEPATTAQPQS